MDIVHMFVFALAAACAICAVGFAIVMSYHLLRFSPSKRVATLAIAIYSLGALVLLLVIAGSAMLVPTV